MRVLTTRVPSIESTNGARHIEHIEETGGPGRSAFMRVVVKLSDPIRSSKPPEGGGGARATLRAPRPTLRPASRTHPRATFGPEGRLEAIPRGLGGSAEGRRRARTDPRTTLAPPLNDASEALQSLLWGLRGSFKGGASARVVRGSVRALRPPTPPTL